MLAYEHQLTYFGTIIILIVFVIFKNVNFKNSQFETDEFCNKIYNNIRCENGGLLERIEKGYVCKCTNDYYGENCTNAKFWRPLNWITFIINNYLDIISGKPGMWWFILPFTSNRQLQTIYSFHQNHLMKLTMFSDVNNYHPKGSKINITSTRILPPFRPLHCLPDNRLPSTTILFSTIFERKHGEFKPDPKRRNLLFYTFYQYFILQFFDTNINLTVTASQLYGTDEITKRALRSFTDGKLKIEFVDNKHPPMDLNYDKYGGPSYLSLFKNVKMVYPRMKNILNSHWFNRITMNLNTYEIPKFKWATNHPLLSMKPMLSVMSSIWVLEHNRVCDILVEKWPTWTDNQIYNTARRIIIGEMMGIVMKEIMVLHSGHRLLDHKPEVFHNHLQNFSSFSTPFELLLTTMWPPALPEKFNNLPLESIIFSSNEKVCMDDIINTIRFMVNQKIGMVAPNNYGAATKPLIQRLITLSRENGLQSFNNYRRQLGLYPYRSFYELTRNQKIAETLKTLYDNVEDVELITGILTESRSKYFVPTSSVMTNSFIINSILTNYLTSKELWKPDTFGGKEGFNIVKTANIQKLIYNNLAENCNGFLVKLYSK